MTPNTPNFLQTWMNFLDRHANPIALLETRHILSLTRTMLMFALLVVGLMLGSWQTIAWENDVYPLVLISAFSIVSIVLIPGQMLFGGTERWSAERVEMLQMSRLRPLDIVLGRMISGIAQLVLLLGVILPFISLSYLLPGTQIESILLILSGIFMISIVTMVFTLAIGWQLEKMAFATLGKVFWLMMLFQGAFACIGMAGVVVEEGILEVWSKGVVFAPWVVVFWVILNYFGIVQSVIHLRHPESNRSTLLRIGVGLLVLFSLAAMVAVYFIEPDAVIAPAIFTIYGLALVGLPFMIEKDQPGRKALVDLPQSRLKRRLLFPLLPSAGSGVLFLGLCFGLITCVGAAFLYMSSETREAKTLLYSGPLLFAVTTMVLPRLRNLQWLESQVRRRICVLLYYPLLFAPFLVMSILMLDDDPFKFFGNYVIPVVLFDKPVRSDHWTWVSTMVGLSIVVNIRAVRNSWRIVMDYDHRQGSLHAEKIAEKDS